MQIARSLRSRINVNKNAFTMFPQKALESMVRVQEKRNTMTEEMQRMGIGKQYADI